MSNVNQESTEKDWIKNNENFYAWYYETYKNLKLGCLPISHSDLVLFYNKDQKERGLTLSETFRIIYAFVFSYYLENYGKDIKDKAIVKDQIDYVIEELNKQVNNINPFGKDSKVGTYAMYGLIGYGAYLIIQLLRGK